MQLVNRASSRGVLGRIGEFFVRIRAFSQKTTWVARAFFLQKTPRIKLVLNPVPKSMDSWGVSLPKSVRPVVKKNRAQIDSYVRCFTSGRPDGRMAGRESGSGLLSHVRPIHTGHPGSLPSLADILSQIIPKQTWAGHMLSRSVNSHVGNLYSYLYAVTLIRIQYHELARRRFYKHTIRSIIHWRNNSKTLRVVNQFKKAFWKCLFGSKKKKTIFGFVFSSRFSVNYFLG